MLPLTELVKDGLRLYAGHPARGAAYLTEASGLEPHTALTLALELLTRERRDIDVLTEKPSPRRRGCEFLEALESLGEANSGRARAQLPSILNGNFPTLREPCHAFACRTQPDREARQYAGEHIRRRARECGRVARSHGGRAKAHGSRAARPGAGATGAGAAATNATAFVVTLVGKR